MTTATATTVPKLCLLSRSSEAASVNSIVNLKVSKSRRKSMELIRTMTGCFMMEVNGGQDVYSPKENPDHLVITVNGIIGSQFQVDSATKATRVDYKGRYIVYLGLYPPLWPMYLGMYRRLTRIVTYLASDWKYAAMQFAKSHPDKVIVHCSECNSSMLTFDGVDMMGERLAAEVVDVIKRWPGVRKISFVAHSLGGLVARYAIGRLYDCDALSCSSHGSDQNGSIENQMSHEARIAGLEPMNFVTFATPHLGSRGHKQLPLLCGLPLLEKGASQTAHWIAGRSGKHLFLTDDDNGQRPLLLQMVNDLDNIKFMSALGSFKRRVAYANVNYDYVVGWGTSSIRHHHEIERLNRVAENEKYPHIVHVERESTDIMKSELISSLGRIMTDLEEEMIRGLSQVPWERVDVSFRKSSQRYVAHNTIQVQNYWMNSDGADVVLHMIDHFQF